MTVTFAAARKKRGWGGGTWGTTEGFFDSCDFAGRDPPQMQNGSSKALVALPRPELRGAHVTCTPAPVLRTQACWRASRWVCSSAPLRCGLVLPRPLFSHLPAPVRKLAGQNRELTAQRIRRSAEMVEGASSTTSVQDQVGLLARPMGTHRIRHRLSRCLFCLPVLRRVVGGPRACVGVHE